MNRFALLAVLMCSACSTYYNHTFLPAPLEVQQQVDGDPDSQARALVTIVGIRKPDSKAGTGARFELRMRLQNLGAKPVQLDLDTMSLVSADLVNFGQADARPAPEPIAAGDEAVYDIAFALPDGHSPNDYNLAGVNLGWTVDFGEQRVTTGVTFERYVSSNSEPRVSVGVGYFRAN